MSKPVKPAARVKAIAKLLVDPVLLEQMAPGAQQTVQELRAQLLEAVKLTPSQRVLHVAGALNDPTLLIQMIGPASERLTELRRELIAAATQLEADE